MNIFRLTYWTCLAFFFLVLSNSRVNCQDDIDELNFMSDVDVEDWLRDKRMTNSELQFPRPGRKKNTEPPKEEEEEVVVEEKVGNFLKNGDICGKVGGGGEKENETATTTTATATAIECDSGMECQNSICVCKNEDNYGERCKKTGKSFFGRRVLSSSTGKNGSAFIQLQEKVEKSLKPFEKLMTLQEGENCSNTLSAKLEEIINYFGNLEGEIKNEELTIQLTSADEASKKGEKICNYKEFLKCDNEKCSYWLDGIVDKAPSGSKIVYKLGDGQICSKPYPKVFESKVEIRCTDMAEGSCSQTSPSTCKCQAGANCEQKSRLAKDELLKGDNELLKNDTNGTTTTTTATTSSPNSGKKKYGEVCQKKEDCMQPMECREYKLKLGATIDEEMADDTGSVRQTALALQDKQFEMQESGGSGGADDSGTPSTLGAGTEQRCHCPIGQAPLDFTTCRKARGQDCTKNSECASKICRAGHCFLDQYGFLFIEWNDLLNAGAADVQIQIITKFLLMLAIGLTVLRFY